MKLREVNAGQSCTVEELHSLSTVHASLCPAGRHTASTHRLSALVTPTGRSYVCTAQQTLTLISSDHQKGVTVSMSDIQIQPFDIASDFMFSERKNTSSCLHLVTTTHRQRREVVMLQPYFSSHGSLGGQCCSMKSTWSCRDGEREGSGVHEDSLQRLRTYC